MSKIVYGSKYAETEGLRTAEIAKRIRADIKAAVAEGRLPRAKYSVVTDVYSMGSSINVRISKVERQGFTLLNPGRLRWDLENPHLGHWACPADHMALYSPEATAVRAAVEAIMAAYNYDGSEPETDYYNVRFHGRAAFASDYEAELREVEEAAVKAALAAAKAAPTAPEPSAQELWLADLGAI